MGTLLLWHSSLGDTDPQVVVIQLSQVQLQEAFPAPNNIPGILSQTSGMRNGV